MCLYSTITQKHTILQQAAASLRGGARLLYKFCILSFLFFLIPYIAVKLTAIPKNIYNHPSCFRVLDNIQQLVIIT